MKSITIAGNCTKDAEVRTTQSGTKVAGFSVAVNGYESGEKTTTYFDVSIFGARAETVTRFATKGAKICVTGDFSTREYNGKTYLQVRGSDFTPMGGGQRDDQSGGYDQSSGYGAGGSPNSGRDLNDEIPFAPAVL